MDEYHAVTTIYHFVARETRNSSTDIAHTSDAFSRRLIRRLIHVTRTSNPPNTNPDSELSRPLHLRPPLHSHIQLLTRSPASNHPDTPSQSHPAFLHLATIPRASLRPAAARPHRAPLPESPPQYPIPSQPSLDLSVTRETTAPSTHPDNYHPQPNPAFHPP